MSFARGNPGLQAKLDQERRMRDGISNHRTGLPPKLLNLFAPRPTPERPAPVHKRPPRVPYRGVSQLIDEFANPGDTEYEPAPASDMPAEPRIFRNPELAAQARVEKESKAEKKIRLKKVRAEQAAQKAEAGAKEYEPAKDPNAQGDPFKTLFVARISYDATDKKMKRDFEEYGPVKRVRLVNDIKTGKPKGYAFVEFEHKADMKNAYKSADGKKVEGKRILVDVERGRTVPNWRPRRLGGGKGGEGREPRPPKDPKKQFLNKIIDKATTGDFSDRRDGNMDAEEQERFAARARRAESDRADLERDDRDRRRLPDRPPPRSYDERPPRDFDRPRGHEDRPPMRDYDRPPREYDRGARDERDRRGDDRKRERDGRDARDGRDGRDGRDKRERERERGDDRASKRPRESDRPRDDRDRRRERDIL